MADPDCAMLGAWDDITWFSATSGSLTVLLITSASGLNRYHSAAPATAAVPMRIDLRVVMLLSFGKMSARFGGGAFSRARPVIKSERQNAASLLVPAGRPPIGPSGVRCP